MNVVRQPLTCDVLVAGGGPAGVPCALAAARNSAQVILCQDRPVLGGNASSEVRMHIVGADAGGKRGIPLETETREGGIIEEIRLETAYRNRQRSASMLDLILYEKCYEQQNLKLMLNTVVDGAVMQHGRIVAVDATRASTEDAFRIEAKIFVDCTGDGRLGFEAGANFHQGREARSEFGEPQAGDVSDEFGLGSSLLFQARDMGRPMPFVPPAFARKFSEYDLRLRPHRSLEYGYWWVEWGGMKDTIQDNETIKHELLAIMLGVWDHIKNGDDHGAENWALDWFGFLPGKRESRRFFGQYRLRQADLEKAINFPDAIAFGGWSLDTHPPEGIDALGQAPCYQPLTDHVYSIPLRTCVSENVENLMFAGRNISASHIAFSSTRVMATCAVVGQGVGTAAGLAIRQGVLPDEMAANNELIHRVQQQLLEDDCFLPGVQHDDPADKAKHAIVSASSHVASGLPANIQTGSTRAVWGAMGARPDLTQKGTHRWMSDPSTDFPAWIDLEWDESVVVGRVQVIFDTGMHRLLTLSHDDRNTARMEWGPQPETVRDYVLRYSDAGGNWADLLLIHDNYQRRRVHGFEPVPMKRLRLIVQSSWGLEQARVIDVRCYEK